MAALNNAQKRYLRGLAHPLKPVILVGAKGVTEAVASETQQALDIHELIKVKIAAGDRELRDAWIDALIAQTESELISRIGNIATLYRPAKKPLITLPRA